MPEIADRTEPPLRRRLGARTARGTRRVSGTRNNVTATRPCATGYLCFSEPTTAPATSSTGGVNSDPFGWVAE